MVDRRGRGVGNGDCPGSGVVGVGVIFKTEAEFLTVALARKRVGVRCVVVRVVRDRRCQVVVLEFGQRVDLVVNPAIIRYVVGIGLVACTPAPVSYVA